MNLMTQISDPYFIKTFVANNKGASTDERNSDAPNHQDGLDEVDEFEQGLFSIVYSKSKDGECDQRLPFVLNSPHSGREYPQNFIQNSYLDAHQLRKSEDYYVDALFAKFITSGVPMLRANFPRAYLDLNREPFELDPKLFNEKLPSNANINSVRVANGLGTLARIVSEGMPIYKKRPSLKAALARIDTLYHPYHEKLLELLVKTFERFDYAILIDCHSMPSNFEGAGNRRSADIIIGDRYGGSCDLALSQALIYQFKRHGYHVLRNEPFAGGFNCEHYGRPDKGLHAVQIEVNRGIYVDEKTYQLKNDFEKIQKDIASVLEAVSQTHSGYFYAKNLAAE